MEGKDERKQGWEGRGRGGDGREGEGEGREGKGRRSKKCTKSMANTTEKQRFGVLAKKDSGRSKATA